MDVRDLIDALGYDKSLSFITSDKFDADPSKAHVFRRARERCGLKGVYALTDRGERGGVPGVTPVVYVCDSEDAKDKAKKDPDELHRLVWNQNTTPFLVVVTASQVRLYPGFQYDPEKPPIRIENTIDKAVAALRGLDLDAESIDQGAVWQSMGKHVTPSSRVDWHLLGNLRDLGKELRHERRLPPRTAHALIGKYVYLRYLRDRGILSDRKLESWELSPGAVFGRSATLDGLSSVDDRLEEWLNGNIFPLSLSSADAPSDEDVKLVASTFEGDEPRSGQMHLGFEAYDFSYIPIETLSNVYEQFLHAEREGEVEGGRGRARQLGAYYTPVHLVDFILDELDSKRPLVEGMKVLDPACGSGAFLVQAYRRLVERERAKVPDSQLTPARLRDLLVGSVFGVDLDEDACRVAHLSLSLTLLDYVKPPDLENSHYRDFRMPDLTKTNIFHCPEGFFDPKAPWQQKMPDPQFDWIASNPPWRDDLKAKPDKPEDRHALTWMQENKSDRPTGGNQLAEAFAWRATDLLGDEGVAGFLLPAMTLFKAESRGFRQHFFSNLDVWCVVNLANLRRDLFADRAEVPAAALFYTRSADEETGTGREASILTYAPMTATQLASRSEQPHRRKEPWVIEVDASEIKEIPRADAGTGDSLVWKAAMWGSPRDIRLIQSLRGRFRTLGQLLGSENLAVAEGPQMRSATASEGLEPCDELSGKMRLLIRRLHRMRRVYSIPEKALERIPGRRVYVREGRKDLPLSICRPPHVIVDVSRRFAVYSDKFIAVPARQIGIAGDRSKAKLLKAIALLLNSHFSRYHDFMVSPQWGVHVGISTQTTLETMPVPFEEMSGKDISRWAALYDGLAKADKAERAERKGREEPLLTHGKRRQAKSVADLEVKLNDLAYRALGLDEDERAMVEDIVNVKLKMIESKWDEELHIRPASKDEMKTYARTLGRVLDEFLDEDDALGHEVAVLYDDHFAWITVTLAEKRRTAAAKVEEASGEAASKLDEVRQHLRREHGQWFYFNRTLRIFEGRTTHMTKPRYRLAWLRSQALADADDLIADILNSGGG